MDAARKGGVAFVAMAVAWIFGCYGKASLTDVEKGPPADSAAVVEGPTYYRDIEPILQVKCSGCHVQGGAAPFALTSYEEAFAFGPAVVNAIQQRRMPPWPPARGGLPLLFDRSLTDDEIEAVGQWANAGFPRGNPADHRNRAPAMPTLREDSEVKMPPWVTPPQNGPRTGDREAYRCFMLGTAVPVDSFVTAFEIRPGNRAIVHHAVLYALSERTAAGAIARLKTLDGQDGSPGFDCPVGPPVNTDEEDLLRFVGSWKPGEGATPLPSGLGIPLAHDDELVLEMHYHALETGAQDQTKVMFELATDGVQAVEDRPIVNKTFSVPPGVPEAVVSAELPIEERTSLVSAFPHMHLLGKSISVSMKRGESERVLLSIPQWQFGWQGSYAFAEPVPLEKGDRIILRCTYDNSAENQPRVNGVKREPQEVHWGGSSLDEMCIAHMFFTNGYDDRGGGSEDHRGKHGDNGSDDRGKDGSGRSGGGSDSSGRGGGK